jgi:hypothetical protein
MNVEIGAGAALFPEKEYISGIFVEVQVIPAEICWLQNSTLPLLRSFSGWGAMQGNSTPGGR